MNIKIATYTFYGFILKIDSSGNIIFKKTLSSNPGLGKAVYLNYLQAYNIVKVSSNNIVINGLVNYYFSSIGYSENSYIDQIVFSFDANGKTQWASVFDYNLNYDSDGKMAYYDSIVYSTLFAISSYPWFFSLNSTNGKYLQSNLFTAFANNVNNFKCKCLTNYF